MISMEASMTPKSLNTRPVMPLSLVAPGETVEVVELRVPDAERQRLQELGLLPGVSVRVIKSDAEHRSDPCAASGWAAGAEPGHGT